MSGPEALVVATPIPPRPYNLDIMDAIVIFLAEADESDLWRVEQIIEGTEKCLHEAQMSKYSQSAIESTLDCLVDGWGLLEWCDPIHLQLTEDGRQARHSYLQSRQKSVPLTPHSQKSSTLSYRATRTSTDAEGRPIFPNDDSPGF
ncbi:hypothetical protein KRMM14A1259_46410 [Krasilnikovia sp. MM14-A1259]